jgi:Ca-activated chloride channel family protein
MTGPEGVFGLDRPQILLGLVPLFIGICVRILGDRRYFRLIAPFAMRYRLSRLCFWISLAALVFSLAGPHWGLRQVTEYRRGLDVMLALDTSRSMEVRDLGPSRLERAVDIGRELAEETSGFRLGTALGRGRGTLALPLTEDRAVIVSFLESLNDMVYTGAGTNLESLINAAASAFLDDSPSRRVIVLVSDGESLSGSLAAAATQARLAGISIAAVGVGTTEGGPVPQGDGGEDEFLSRLRREALEEATDRTGGIYLNGADPQAGSNLRAYLESLAVERETGGLRRENRPRWRLFLMIALAALGLSKLWMRRGAPRGGRNPAAPGESGAGTGTGGRARDGGGALIRGVLFILLSPLALSYQSCSPVSGKLLVVEGNFYHSQGRYDEAIRAYGKALEYPEALPYAEYGLGSVYTSLEELPAALGRFDAALAAWRDQGTRGREELGYRIHYNRGVALFWKGDFEGAAGAFRGALEIDSGRIEAKRNLELSLLSLSQENDREPETLGEGTNDRLMVLFHYLNLKEQQQWKSREWEEEPPSLGPDY